MAETLDKSCKPVFYKNKGLPLRKLFYGIFGTRYASKICGRPPLKNFTWSIVEYLDPSVVA